MNEYSKFPPLNTFKIVLRSCPQSALLFALLWGQKQNSNSISIPRSDIKKKFLISPTLFRNHLIALGRLELLSFEETIDYFLIDFYEVNER